MNDDLEPTYGGRTLVQIEESGEDLSLYDDCDNDSTDLIARLVASDPNMRPEYEQVQSHPFFNGIDWKPIEQFMSDGVIHPLQYMEHSHFAYFLKHSEFPNYRIQF